mmetsp:Transcript_28430/g.87092  ORF Transcript_28430/g.87092 Transcript_28430/m.87092 type:complete len:254 (+) Transcript_28430:424-1185(+)
MWAPSRMGFRATAAAVSPLRAKRSRTLAWSRQPALRSAKGPRMGTSSSVLDTGVSGAAASRVPVTTTLPCVKARRARRPMPVASPATRLVSKNARIQTSRYFRTAARRFSPAFWPPTPTTLRGSISGRHVVVLLGVASSAQACSSTRNGSTSPSSRSFSMRARPPSSNCFGVSLVRRRADPGQRAWIARHSSSRRSSSGTSTWSQNHRNATWTASASVDAERLTAPLFAIPRSALAAALTPTRRRRVVMVCPL